MSRSMLRWAVLAILLAVVLLVIVTRSPTLRVTAVDPAAGAVLATSPREVSIALTGARDPIAVHLTVQRQDGGRVVTTGAAQLRGDRLVVPVSIVDSGAYVAAYHVQLAGGQQVSGSSQFSVAVPGQPTVAGRAAPDPAVATGAHDHGSGDPLTTILFLIVDLVLTGVLVTFLLRRPRLRGEGMAVNSRGPTKGDDR